MPARDTTPNRAGDHQGRPPGHVHASVEDALAAVRARGGRLTRQRTLIWQAILDHADTHLSASEIAEAVRGLSPELHRATIYRTLETLVEDGLLLRTDLGGDCSYYELRGDHRHHHVVCSMCGAVAHFHDEEIGAIGERVEAASGYTLEDRELTFRGQCLGCANS